MKAAENNVATKISHNSEEYFEVEHCHDPGCYSRPIVYDVPMEQIQSLIELSSSCSQRIRYDCFLSPLEEDGVNFGYWIDTNGDNQYYWTGSNYGKHVCSCYYSEEGCIEQSTLNNTCHCDAKVPKEMADDGVITNSTALPVKELRFGGLSFAAQTGFHTLGKLSCSGKKSDDEANDKPVSCSALKKHGYFKSGYYNVQDGQYSKLVYCDMATLSLQSLL